LKEPFFLLFKVSNKKREKKREMDIINAKRVSFSFDTNFRRALVVSEKERKQQEREN
jgi:hypothetical protein